MAIFKPKICIGKANKTEQQEENLSMQILPKAAYGGVNPPSRNKLRRGGPKGRFCYCKIWVKKFLHENRLLLRHLK